MHDMEQDPLEINDDASLKILAHFQLKQDLVSLSETCHDYNRQTALPMRQKS